MSNFMNLIWNEQIKLYAKKSTWIMFAVLAVIALGGGLLTKFMDTESNFKEYGENWQAEVQEENVQLAAEMEEDEFLEFSNPIIIEENNYYLENNIKPQPYDGWEYVLENSFLSSLISLFTIIVAAGIISNEFKWGTIKLLLIRPISRTKILFAKYASVLIFALSLLLFLLVASWITGALLFGLNGLNPSIVQQQAGGFAQNGALGEIVQAYGLSLVTLVMMATFAFMISAIFRSSGMAIGLAIFLMMAGNAIVAFLAQYEWSKYILFANTNLEQYMGGGEPMIEGMTLTFSLVVLLVYFALFLGAAWTAFTKRDIAGQ
ncbi:ABC-type transport system permease protein [Planococcus antarcticus DSM 14505]|uniref:ABC transporter permease n=1 Tax=Planococcus antarcticus DSM 14505 TaxID=1185653 RepID=A0A1C7DDS5_9BACL|nr:ABC transporter permease [Planococcus antarcticus]ANU09636.1 ABC transporter permease [Planococcus antarcticus DSM 14505]EIM05351.1 ABC-type transport system permease protein [Planococcus antarcticus DSM 14505]